MFKEKEGVLDLQWDPLSDNYLLVCWKEGEMSLLDGVSYKEM